MAIKLRPSYTTYSYVLRCDYSQFTHKHRPGMQGQLSGVLPSSHSQHGCHPRSRKCGSREVHFSWTASARIPSTCGELMRPPISHVESWCGDASPHEESSCGDPFPHAEKWCRDASLHAESWCIGPSPHVEKWSGELSPHVHVLLLWLRLSFHMERRSC